MDFVLPAQAADPLGPCLLFCPGNRPDRFQKALASGADQIILDLEDAVAPGDKHAARRSVVAALQRPDLARRAVVRINAYDTPIGRDDVAALAQTRVAGVMVPKCERPELIGELGAACSGWSPRIHLLIESSAGVFVARELCSASPLVTSVAWGPYDLAVDLGASGSADGYTTTQVLLRDTVLLAGAAARIARIDTPTLEIDDLSTTARDAEAAARLGFDAKLAIHPAQVPVIRGAFAPSAQAVADARELLATASREGATFAYHGRMVDRPMLEAAHRIIELSERLL